MWNCGLQIDFPFFDVLPTKQLHTHCLCVVKCKNFLIFSTPLFSEATFFKKIFLQVLLFLRWSFETFQFNFFKNLLLDWILQDTSFDFTPFKNQFCLGILGIVTNFRFLVFSSFYFSNYISLSLFAWTLYFRQLKGTPFIALRHIN